MLQENLVDFNPFRGILSVSRESDRSNIHVECTVRSRIMGTHRINVDSTCLKSIRMLNQN